MKYNEFNDIEIPEVLTGAGWQDTSWHNDATASSELKVNDLYSVVVWVWADDPEAREITTEHKFEVKVSSINGLEGFAEAANTTEELLACIDNAKKWIETRSGELKLIQTVSKAIEGFWAIVAQEYTEARSGDFDPESDMKFARACSEAVRVWVSYNVNNEVQ
jgi:hypothetical protein